MAEIVVGAQADYVLSVKKKQGRLYESLTDLFAGAQEVAYQADYARTVNKDHGRLEIREGWTISDEEFLSYLRTLNQ